MVLYAGESVGVMHEILPAGEIVTNVAEQANSVLERFGGEG